MWWFWKHLFHRGCRAWAGTPPSGPGCSKPSLAFTFPLLTSSVTAVSLVLSFLHPWCARGKKQLGSKSWFENNFNQLNQIGVFNRDPFLVFQLSWELFLKDRAVRAFFTPSVFIYGIYIFAPKCWCLFWLKSLGKGWTPGHPFPFLSSSFLEEEEALPFSSAVGNGLKLHQGKFGLDLRRISSWRRWSGIGTSCPGKSPGWSLHPWKCWLNSWMWHLGTGLVVDLAVLD